jgi:hypothetical protein
MVVRANSPIDSAASTTSEHEQNCVWAETESCSTMPEVPEKINYRDAESVTSTLSYQPSCSFVSAASTTTDHERNCFWAETKSSSTMPKLPLHERNCFWAETKSSSTMPKLPLRRSVRNSNDIVAKAPLRRGPRTVCNSNDTVPKAPLRRRGLSDDFSLMCCPNNKVFHPIPAQSSWINHDRQTLFHGRAA